MFKFFENISLWSFLLSEKILSEYKSIFKAGIVLLGIGLIGLSEPFVKLLEIDYKTKEIKYEVVAAAKVHVSKFSNIDCYKLDKSILSKCLYAKYRLESDSGAIKLGGQIITAFLIFGIAFVIASILLACVTFWPEKKHNKHIKFAPVGRRTRKNSAPLM